MVQDEDDGPDTDGSCKCVE